MTRGSGTVEARERWVAGAVIALALLALVIPVLTGQLGPDPSATGWLFTATQAFALLALASSWNIVAGRLRRLDLGHSVYFGIGAYAAGLVMVALQWTPVVALVAGAGCAAAGAAVVGAVTLRLPPHLFAVATLALLVGTREAMRLAAPLTGGDPVLAVPPRLSPAVLYYAMLSVCLATVVLAWALRYGPLRDYVGAVPGSRSVSTTARVAVYAAASAATGLVGALWAFQRLFIDPANAFMTMRSFDMALAAILGGLGTVIGPLVGGTVLVVVRDLWPVGFADWQVPLAGLTLVALVLLAPNGIVGRRAEGTGAALFGALVGRPVTPTERRGG